MVYAEFHQAASDNLDYTVSFASWLGQVSDTISAVTWSVPAALTAANDSFTTTTAKNYLSGGTVGQRYVVSATITTAATPALTKIASFGLTIEADV